MAWTTAERDALKAALASGALSVSYGDKAVTYRSFEAMKELLADMNRELNGEVRKRIIRTTTQGDRGY